MLLNKKIHKAISIIMMTSLLFVQIPRTNFTAQASTVDATVTISPLKMGTINNGVFQGWGTSLCWWANRVGYSDTLSQKAAELFYNKNTGLGLNIMRYNIGGGDDPTHDHITRTDSEVPGYATSVSGSAISDDLTWSYDWTADKNQRNVLAKAVAEAGSESIVEAFSNSPPYFMTNSGCATGAVNASQNNLNNNCYDDFAKYMADVALHFKDSFGITFQSITAMNEPYTNYWSALSNKQEGCHFDQGTSQSNMITSLKTALVNNGLNDMIISGTDETSIDTQITSYNSLTQEAQDTISRIDTHTYSGSNRSGLKALAEAENKNLWMSEVDGGDTAGTNAGEMGAGLWLAQRITTDMNGLTPTAWIMWNIIDNHMSTAGANGNVDNGDIDRSGGYWGIAVADHDTQTINLSMKYYAFGQFTRYIRPGYKIIAGTANTLAAYDEVGKKLVIVVTNTASSDKSYDFDLSQFSSIGNKVNVIRTSGSMENGEKWAELDPLATYGSGFYATLKANSVTTYIVEGVENNSAALNEIALSSSMVTGSAPWGNSTTNTVAKTVDGNTTTFFDGVENGYVKIDLGSNYSLDAIGYAPRPGYEYRCVDASFSGSLDGVNWIPLTKITSTPTSGINYIYAKRFTNNITVRYVKYAVPSGVPNNGVNNDGSYNCNIAELKLYGSAETSVKKILSSMYQVYSTLQKGYYSDTTFTALQTALSDVSAVLSSDSSTDTDYQDAITSLNTAYSGLELSDNNPVSVVSNTITVASIVNQTPNLPKTVAVNTKGGTVAQAAITWNVKMSQLTTAYSTVTIIGTVDNTSLTVSASVELIPENLRYFIDCGTITNGSNTYNLVKNYVTDLKNTTSDQTYNSATNTWGVYGTYNGYSGSVSTDKFLTGYYGNNNSTNPICYNLYLDKGTYNVTVQAHEWWSGPRTMNMSAEYVDANGTTQTVTIGASVVVRSTARDAIKSGKITLDHATNLTVKVYKVAGTEAPSITFLGVAQEYQDAAISPLTASFDKNLKNQADVSSTITWNDATTITGITASGEALNTNAYTVSGSALTIKKEYLATKATGDLTFTVGFDKGNSKTFTINIVSTTPINALVTPSTGNFDKNTAYQADVSTAITWNDAATVTDIKNSGVSIGVDSYTLVGNSLTIDKEYLASKAIGDLVLSVEFDNGNASTYTIHISDTTPVIIDSASISQIAKNFDKKVANQTDVTTEITWNDASIVTDIKKVDVSIGTSAYTVSENTITITKEYLATQPIGNLSLTVEFDEGDSAIWNISITDTTEPIIVAAVIAPTTGSFDLNTMYQADVSTTITLNDAEQVTDVKKNGISIGSGAYEVSGNSLTIKKNYLSGLQSGSLTLVVEFKKGTSAQWIINISNSTPIQTEEPVVVATPIPTATTATPIPTAAPTLETVTLEGGNGKATLVINPVDAKGKINVAVEVKTEDNQETTKETNLSIKSDAVKELLHADSTKSVDVAVTLSSNIQNTNIRLDDSLLEAAKEVSKDVSVSVADNKGNELFSWTFKGSDLTSSKQEVTEVNLALEVEALNSDTQLNKLLDQDNKDAKGLVINFSHEGVLPAQASIKVYVGNQTDIKVGDAVYLYHYNTVTSRLDELPGKTTYTVDENGYITIDIVHCSDYVILKNEAGSAIATALADQISVSPAKKLLYLTEKSNSTSIEIIFPATLELVKKLDDTVSERATGEVTTTFKSNHKSVAVVDSNGKITAKGNGTAIITTTIHLSNGETKTFDTTITVKKPYIKLLNTTKTMKIGETFNFQAKAYGFDNKAIVWLTTEKSIITIDKLTGVATAKTKGIDYVVAKIGNETVKIKVTVK